MHRLAPPLVVLAGVAGRGGKGDRGLGPGASDGDGEAEEVMGRAIVSIRTPADWAALIGPTTAGPRSTQRKGAGSPRSPGCSASNRAYSASLMDLSRPSDMDDLPFGAAAVVIQNA